MAHDSNGSKELMILTAAERRLAECTEMDEVMQVRDVAETLRNLAKKQRRGLKFQNRAAKLKIQAERKIGEALAEMNLKRGRRKEMYHDGTFALRLEDLGFSRNQSSRWQQEARLSDEEFEAYCRDVEKRSEEISSGAWLRFVRSTRRFRHPAHPRRKPHSGVLNEEPRPGPVPESSVVEGALAEIRGHLQFLERIAATTCSQKCSHLKNIELRQIPRYLREVSARLDEIEQYMKACR